MVSIYTLTLSPSLDSATLTPQIYPEGKLRCSAPVFEPGGGGIDFQRSAYSMKRARFSGSRFQRSRTGAISSSRWAGVSWSQAGSGVAAGLLASCASAAAGASASATSRNRGAVWRRMAYSIASRGASAEPSQA